MSRVSALLASMAALCSLALGLALLAQYSFEMRPCAWCVLQRLLYILLAIFLSLAAAIGRPLIRKTLASLCVVICAAGATAALYQHHVAAKLLSCDLTLADKIISLTGLDQSLPSLFSATASCAQASVAVVGIPFAYWSFGLFMLLCMGSIWTLKLSRSLKN
jgi:protein dithiol:quinone oxidoreductase